MTEQAIEAEIQAKGLDATKKTYRSWFLCGVTPIFVRRIGLPGS